MSESSESRARGAVPWGMIGMIALVVAVEWYWVRCNLGIISGQALSWQYVSRQVRWKAPGCKILCFGDSMIKMGVLPKVFKRETGRRAFNLALYGGPAPASYFLLRRVLEAGAQPEAVLVDFVSEILAQGPQSKVRPYCWSDLLNARDALDLAWTARDANLFARIMVGEVLPSFNRRFDIRARVMEGLKGQRLEVKGHFRYLRWHWNTNGGAELNLPQQAAEIAPPPNVPPLPGTWRCDPVNGHYLRRFLDLAAARQIPVYWLLPPMHPGYQAHIEFRGEDALFDKFLREMLDRYPNLVAIDGRRSGYDRTAFIDNVHLSQDGATTYTGSLAEVIIQHGTGGSADPRWAKLPDYHTALARSIKNGSETSRPSRLANDPSHRGRRQ